VRRIERFKCVLLSTLIIASLTLPGIAATSILSATSVSASPDGYEIIIRGKGTAYNVDFTDDEPWIWYAQGDLPPIMAAKRVDSGAVVAAGTAPTCRGGTTYPAPQRWVSGEWDVLLDKVFQWMVPGATKVLWYGEYGFDYGVYEDAARCSYLIDALEAKGYAIDNTMDSTATPIDTSLLAPYDILVIPELRLGDGNIGGDPSLLPWSDVQAIKSFVKGGGGLLIMDGCDFAGGNYYKVQNKILCALNMGIYFQSDEIYDDSNWWGDGPWFPIADVDPWSEIGAAYQTATGKTDVKLFSLCSLGEGYIEPPPGLVGWWPGDGNAFDIIGTNNGTLMNGATFAPGKVDEAFSFDGVDDVVWAPGTNIDDLQQLTIDAWVKLDSLPYGQIERFVTLAGEKAVLRYDGGNGPRQLHFYMKIDGWLRGIRVNNVLETGVFHHVAGTYDGSIMRLYLDGVEVGNLMVSGTVGAGTGVILSSDEEPLDGLLDEIEIYNRALSALEIQSIFSAGTTGKCKPPPWGRDIEWVRQFGSPNYDYAYGVAVDASGNVCVGGYTGGVLPGQTSFGGDDAFVRKYDGSGNELWTRQFGTSSGDAVVGVAVDSSGNVYVAGITGGALPGQTSSGGWDAFVRKYNGSGNVLWTRQFGTSASDYAYGVAVDGSGNVCVAGYTDGALPGQTSSGSRDAFVRKYDGSGNVLWTRQFGTSASDYAYGVAVDASGNVYVTGETWGALPGQTFSGYYDAFVRKYDDSGNELWTRQFGTSYWDEARGVAVDSFGNVYVAGSTRGVLPGQTSSGYSDAFIRKYDGSGNELWTRQFGTSDSDEARGVAVDASGNVCVAGYFYGWDSWGTFYNHVFVRKYDGPGNELWTRQFGSLGYDYAEGVAADASGNVYVAGYTDGALPGQTSSGGRDAFVVKFVKVKPKLYIVYEIGGRGDLSFNDMAYMGGRRAEQELGVELVEMRSATEADYVPNLRAAASDPSAKLIVGVGYLLTDALVQVAKEFPDKNFVGIDTYSRSVEPQPNLLDVVFEEHKGSALVGALAAMLAYHYGKPYVGAVLGIEIPVLWKFEIGYKWGAEYWAPAWYRQRFGEWPPIVDTLWTYTGTFSDITKGYEAAKPMYAQGAVAVYNIAGPLGLGINQAVKEIAESEGLEDGPPFWIGVDTDQDWINPGFVIASMIKRVDRGVYYITQLVMEDKFRDAVAEYGNQITLGIGTTVLGIPMEGISVSTLEDLDAFIEMGIEAGIIGPEDRDTIYTKVKAMRDNQPAWIWEAVAELEEKIRTGEVEVPMVMTDAIYYWRGIFEKLPAPADIEFVPTGTTAVDARAETDTAVTINTNQAGSVAVIKYKDNPGGPPPSGFMALGKYIEVLTDVPSGNINWPIEIRIYYTDSEIAAAGISEGSLRIYYWDGNNWVEEPDSGVNIGNNYVWARVNHLSPFAPMGSRLAAPVGGIAFPVNKLALLAPWIILAALIAIAAVSVAVYWRRR